jgi:cytochrome P450
LMTLFLEVLRSSRYNEKIYAEWKVFLGGKTINSAEDFTSFVTEFVQTSDVLHSCYLEVMRLYPIIPIIKRVAKKDFILGDTYVYAGDAIHLNIMAAQRDKRHWEQPDQFYPTRFQGDLANHKSPPLFNFSVGSQGCIGKYLAESEVEVMGALFSILLTPIPTPLPTPHTSSEPREEISPEESRREIVENFHYDGFVLKRQHGQMIYKHTFQLRHEWKNFIFW